MIRTAIALGAVVLAALAPSARAQDQPYPRLGVSAAPDRYVPVIDVAGDDTFEVYVIALGPTDDQPLAGGYTSLRWSIFEACCGGAATILDADLAGGWNHDGTCLGGVLSTSASCQEGPALRLATLTLRMVVPQSGEYQLLCGPIDLGYDCAGHGVVMTDLPLVIRYAGGGSTAGAPATLGAVKSGFR